MFNENIIFVIWTKNFKLLGDKNIIFFCTWHQRWKKFWAVWDVWVTLLCWPLLRGIEVRELWAELRRAFRVLKYFYWVKIFLWTDVKILLQHQILCLALIRLSSFLPRRSISRRWNWSLWESKITELSSSRTKIIAFSVEQRRKETFFKRLSFVNFPYKQD